MPRTAFLKQANKAGYWLDICRAYARGDRPRMSLRKTADLGGAGNDIPFEQAFSNLAHAYLRDVAPSLLDHELGFQLVDRSDDDKKAIGILAAKVGAQRVFVPLFFLKNNIKGHEMLYLCERDLFVPLNEKWLNDIINRKPDILGTGINRQDAMRNITNPNLQRLRQSPYKFASTVIPAVQPFLPKLASLVTPDAWGEETQAAAAYFADRFNLPVFLKTAGQRTLETFVHWMQQYPQIAAATRDFYGIDEISQIIKQAHADAAVRSVLAPKLVSKYQTPTITGSIFANDLRVKQAAVNAQVEVLYADQLGDTAMAELPDDVRSQLLCRRVFIKDARADEDTSKPYRVKVTEKLFNPTESGLYMVLVKPGTFAKCYVAVHPQGGSGRMDFVTLVRLDESSRSWMNGYAANVWCTNVDDEAPEGPAGLTNDIEAFHTWHAALPAADSLPTESHAFHMLVGPRGEATLPFMVHSELGDGSGTKLYDVRFESYVDGTPRGRRPALPVVDGYDKYNDGERIRLGDNQGARLRAFRGDVLIPAGYRLLRVSPEYATDEPCNVGDRVRPLQPGNLIDAELAVHDKTAALRIMCDQHEYRVNSSRPLSKLAALVHLVKDHGLRETTAEELLRLAPHGRPFTCRIKYADPYMSQTGPSAPSFPEDLGTAGGNPMGFAGPTSTGQRTTMPVSDMSAQNSDPMRQNPNPMYDTPMYGQGSGGGGGAPPGGQYQQRETFDTAMISSLLRSMSDDSLVDRWLPDLITGMDRLGRLLFSYYWHGDRFSERYGQRDMPELGDSLRNAFEIMGDVIAFLEKKTVRANPEESLRALNLGPAASI